MPEQQDVMPANVKSTPVSMDTLSLPTENNVWRKDQSYHPHQSRLSLS